MELWGVYRKHAEKSRIYTKSAPAELQQLSPEHAEEWSLNSEKWTFRAGGWPGVS